jgi:RNA polymerase sigma-B factor
LEEGGLGGAATPGGAPEAGARTDAMFEQYSATKDPELRDRLVAAHRDLATYLARRFANRGQPLPDLTGVAEEGLAASVDSFDPRGPVGFPSHAAKVIVSALKEYMRQRGWATSAPRRTHELYVRLSEAVDPLSASLGRAPTIANLAAAVDASEEEVLEALEAGQAYRFAFAGTPESDRRQPGGPDVVAVPDPVAPAGAGAVDEETDGILRHLPAGEREVARLRLFVGLSQPEIARHLGIPQTNVSRLLARSVSQLRSVSEVSGGSSPAGETR